MPTMIGPVLCLTIEECIELSRQLVNSVSKAEIEKGVASKELKASELCGLILIAKDEFLEWRANLLKKNQRAAAIQSREELKTRVPKELEAWRKYQKAEYEKGQIALKESEERRKKSAEERAQRMEKERIAKAEKDRMARMNKQRVPVII